MSSTGTTFYSPETLDSWLRRWDDLSARAERPSGGHGTGLRTGGGGPASMGRWACLRADIEAAAESLPSTSLAYRVVAERMARPAALDTIAKRLHRRADAVRQAYPEAIRAMSAALGYPVDHSTWGRPEPSPALMTGSTFVDSAASAA